MGMRYMAAFPATNNSHLNVAKLYKGIVERLLQKFAPFRFNTVVIDTKMGKPNIYTTNGGYKLENRFEEKEPQKPIIRFEFINKGNNFEDTQLGLYKLKRMANAHGFDFENEGFVPFFLDIFETRFWYSTAFTRSDLNINIIVNSKDDQLAFNNIIDTNLNQHYGEYFKNVPMGHYLPRDLILTYKEALFKRNLITLRDPLTSQDDKDTLTKLINDNFREYLIMYSSGYIDGEKLYKDSVSDYIYDLLVYRNIYVKYEKFQMDDGEKRNDVYTRYNINTSGFIEFHNIMNYVIDFPSVVNGNFIEDELFVIHNEDTNKTLTKLFAKKMVDTHENDPFFNFVDHKNRYVCFWFEDDIVVDSQKETFNIYETFIPKENDLSIKFALIYNSMTEREVEDYIHISVYEKGKLLTRNVDYEQNGLTITLLNAKTIFPYSVGLHIDKWAFGGKWVKIGKGIVKELEKDYVLNNKDKELINDFISLEEEMGNEYRKVSPELFDISNYKLNINTFKIGNIDDVKLAYRKLFENKLKDIKNGY